MDNIQNYETNNNLPGNSTEQNEEISQSYAVIEKKKKIRNYINEGNFKAILPFLSKEDRNDFVEVVSEAMDERNSKLFWRKLDEYCAETLDEAQKRRIFEDIQASMVYEDLIRSKKREVISEQVTSHIQELKQKNSNGEYLTVGDKYFLEDNDDESFNISEQNRANKFRLEKFDSMTNLGKINAYGNNNINRNRIINNINELISEKQEFISRGGDLHNSIIDYDKQIEQLYEALEDTKKMDSVLSNFYGERENQRQIDASVRSKQVDAMKQAIQNNQAMQQIVSENIDSNSIGGMSR